MSGHTPGPWVYVGGKYGYEIQTPTPNDKGAITIVGSQSTAYRSPEENEANANLIAAAPDLLAALELALSARDDDKSWEDCAQAAILKAKGGRA